MDAGGGLGSTGLSSVLEGLFPVVQGSEVGGLSGECSRHEDHVSTTSQLLEPSRRAVEPTPAILALPSRNSGRLQGCAHGSLPNRDRPCPRVVLSL